jgi:hypothetical protein
VFLILLLMSCNDQEAGIKILITMLILHLEMYLQCAHKVPGAFQINYKLMFVCSPFYYGLLNTDVVLSQLGKSYTPYIVFSFAIFLWRVSV